MRLICTVISCQLSVLGSTSPGTQEVEPENAQPRDSRDNPSQDAVSGGCRLGWGSPGLPGKGVFTQLSVSPPRSPRQGSPHLAQVTLPPAPCLPRVAALLPTTRREGLRPAPQVRLPLQGDVAINLVTQARPPLPLSPNHWWPAHARPSTHLHSGSGLQHQRRAGGRGGRGSPGCGVSRWRGAVGASTPVSPLGSLSPAPTRPRVSRVSPACGAHGGRARGGCFPVTTSQVSGR